MSARGHDETSKSAPADGTQLPPCLQTAVAHVQTSKRLETPLEPVLAAGGKKTLEMMYRDELSGFLEDALKAAAVGGAKQIAKLFSQDAHPPKRNDIIMYSRHSASENRLTRGAHPSSRRLETTAGSDILLYRTVQKMAQAHAVAIISQLEPYLSGTSVNTHDLKTETPSICAKASRSTNNFVLSS